MRIVVLVYADVLFSVGRVGWGDIRQKDRCCKREVAAGENERAGIAVDDRSHINYAVAVKTFIFFDGIEKICVDITVYRIFDDHIEHLVF